MKWKHTFSVARTAAPATVFRRLAFAAAAGFFGSSSSTLSIKGFGGFRTLKAIRGADSPWSEEAADVGGVKIDCRSRLARVASADKSSGLQPKLGISDHSSRLKISS
jgi:hypothetical protein